MTLNRWAILLIISSLYSDCLADAFQLEELYAPAYQPQTNVEIMWAATNELPRRLWIYKTAPQEFSTAVISNMMALCDFTWGNLRTKSGPNGKDSIRFTDKATGWTRYLEISPALGWIEYHADSLNTTNIAPEKAEVRRLAQDVLFDLGIDRSLLCDEKCGYETVRGKLSLDGQRLSTNVVERGISFARQIDGIESKNAACFLLLVEGGGRIRHLELSWRRLIPFEPRSAATPIEVAQYIRTGRAKLPQQPDIPADIDKAHELTITDVELRYFDSKGSAPLDLSYPLAVIKAQAIFGGSNLSTLYLECPIVSTNQLKTTGLSRRNN